MKCSGTSLRHHLHQISLITTPTSSTITLRMCPLHQRLWKVTRKLLRMLFPLLLYLPTSNQLHHPFSSPSHTSPSHPSSHSGYKHSAYTSVPLSHAPTTMSHGPIPAAAMVQPPYPVAYTIPPSEQWGHHSQQQKVKGYPKITVRSSGVPVYHHSQPQHNKSTTSPPPSHLPYPPQPASTKIGVSSGVIAHSAATNGDVMLLVSTDACRSFEIQSLYYITDFNVH